MIKLSIINYRELERVVLEKFNLAKNNLVILEKSEIFSQDISNNIPNYDIKEMEFATYEQDNFVSFFADMRESTNRALEIGAKGTFLTIHAVMPTIIYVIHKYGGNIIDLPGDGVMALFKGNPRGIYNEVNEGKLYYNEETLAVRCGEDLLEAFNTVVNPILINNGIIPVTFGVGIDTGEVVVTKVGINNISDVKAIGNCINFSSKISNGYNKICISKETHSNLINRLQSNYNKSYWVDEKLGKNIEIYSRQIN